MTTHPDTREIVVRSFSAALEAASCGALVRLECDDAEIAEACADKLRDRLGRKTFKQLVRVVVREEP